MIMGPMSRTILVVDDDAHIRQLLVFALEKAGQRAIEAEDGEAALVAVQTQSPDLVILDINMPKMDKRLIERLLSPLNISATMMSNNNKIPFR